MAIKSLLWYIVQCVNVDISRYSTLEYEYKAIASTTLLRMSAVAVDEEETLWKGQRHI